jgi:hypothetical protein
MARDHVTQAAVAPPGTVSTPSPSSAQAQC